MRKAVGRWTKRSPAHKRQLVKFNSFEIEGQVCSIKPKHEMLCVCVCACHFHLRCLVTVRTKECWWTMWRLWRDVQRRKVGFKKIMWAGANRTKVFPQWNFCQHSVRAAAALVHICLHTLYSRSRALAHSWFVAKSGFRHACMYAESWQVGRYVCMASQVGCCLERTTKCWPIGRFPLVEWRKLIGFRQFQSIKVSMAYTLCI